MSRTQVPPFSPSVPPPSSNLPPVLPLVAKESERNVLGQILNTLEKIHGVLEKKENIVNRSVSSDSEFESFYSAASSSSKFPSSTPRTCSSNSSSRTSSSTSSKWWSKAELKEERICIRFQHGSCEYDDDHPGKSHLCAKCFLSFDELLENDHGADWCPNY